MPANQTTVLKAIAESGNTPLSLDAICAVVSPGEPHGPKTKLRKLVIKAVGGLMQKVLISRATRRRDTFGGNAYVEYAATPDGLKQASSGASIPSGGKAGPRACLSKPKGDMRQRLWAALRIAGKTTIPALVELVRQDGDPPAVKVIGNAYKYFADLERAGIVARMGVKAKGDAPTSNGFNRFALMRDLGPTAPSAGKRHVTDHNARERISYREVP